MTEEKINDKTLTETEINPEQEADKNAETETHEEESGKFKWYAVRIISGHENKVKAYLDNEIRTEKLEDRINNVLIPLEKVFEVKAGKKKIRLKNFLPGYILIEADLDDKIRDFVSKTPSIINMVGSKSVKGKRLEPIPLKALEVKRIKAILNDEADEDKLDVFLNVGDPVKVTSGPFNNFSGNILEVNLEKLKVKVMVSIFGRKTPIELELGQIEKEK
ncbi:MAG: transcription termination/antitermination factor NusG [Ignavibacteria bacterium]|nr:transcription termination/antitermination factor NusG [Ignavibacteria bacterium]MBK6771423.1 transcription termination/antitermination factor NusG [Ignavibacteria bacterium]MBK7159417.1 transcription termination/antitermination factor NusG [Ignavibacteria bacterium]